MTSNDDHDGREEMHDPGSSWVATIFRRGEARGYFAAIRRGDAWSPGVGAYGTIYAGGGFTSANGLQPYFVGFDL